MTKGKLPLTPWKATGDDVFDGVDLEDVRPDKQGHQAYRQQASSLSDDETADPLIPAQVGVEDVENTLAVAPTGLVSCFRSSRRSSKDAKTGFSSSQHLTRKIRFNEMAMVIWIESIDEMSDAEFDACFMASQEYLNIREREKGLFRQLSAMGMIRSAGDDCLGLETRVQRHQRKGRSRGSICAVIFEQEMSRDSRTGVCSDYFLAQVYQPFTEVATRMALARATKNTMQASLCDDSNRYLDFVNNSVKDCSPLQLQSDEQMEEVYHDLKETVETVQTNVYKGVLKYAVACIPPSPATLRLGHGNFLEMSQKEDVQPWSERQQISGQDPAEYYDDGYAEDGEEKKSDAPSRQEILRNSFEPPQVTQCGQEYYRAQANVHQQHRHSHQQSRWLADKHNRGAFQASQHHLQAQYSAPPSAGFVWNPALCDFVPVPTTRTVPWNV
ncbi:MAG: hypothetical protein SGILL_010731 [Bacillariaceae sp.]